MKSTYQVRYYALPMMSLGLVVALSVACGRKKSSGSGIVSEIAQVLSTPEDSVVTSETSQLALSSELILMPAKGASSSSLHGSEVGNLLLGDKVASLHLQGRHASDAMQPRPLHLRVSNDAFEAIDSVSNIMCYFSQTKFWEQANAGEYQALVDSQKCEQDQGSSDGSSQQSNYVKAYVISERDEANHKPLQAKIRFVMEKGDNSQEYHAQIYVAAPPDDTNPAGLFSMNFTGYGNGENMGGGFIRTEIAEGGKFKLFYAEKGTEGDGSRDVSAAALLEKSGDDFIGQITSKLSQSGQDNGQSYTRTTDYKTAFDANFMRVSGNVKDYQDTSAQAVAKCFDRNKYVTNIYNYDVVDSSGNVVELNSGFPIEYVKDGKTYQGNAGYFGVYLSGGATPSDGDKVSKVTWKDGSKSTQEYTYVKAPGKLVKFTKASTTLGALKGLDLQFWDNGQYIVHWDGSSLKKISSVSNGSNGPVETPLSTSEQTFSMPQWGANFYVDSLSANVQIAPDATLSDDLVIAYHSQKVVSGTDDAPSGDLVCFQNCPKMAITGDDLKQSQGGQQQQNNCPQTQSAYETTSVTFGQQTCSSNSTQDLKSEHVIATYTYDASTYNLKKGSTSFSVDESYSGDKSQLMGMQSGPLVPKASYDALSTAVKNKWPGALENELDVYYQWQSGLNDWSRFTAVKDANGKIAAFDKPMEFTYVHSASNDFDGNSSSPAVGKSFRLQYGGPGQLWGIPFKYNSDLKRGAALFSLKTATDLGNGYKAYPINGDQYTKAADDSSCSGLSLDSMPTLPTFENKNIKNALPSKDDVPLRYIGGESVEE